MKILKSNKLIIALCFVLLNVGLASSQLKFGVKGGFDVSNNRINKDVLNASNRLGFQIGLTTDVRVPIVGLGFELSALYGHQEYDLKDEKYDLSSYNYIRVPLNIKYKYNFVGLFGVFVAAGPYAEFKVSGGNLKSVSEEWKSKSFGAGVNAGAGVSLLSHLEVGMYYRKSLTNNYSDNDIFKNMLKKKTDNWSVNLTYFF